ncbi:MAG TPA: AAA family ATPase, partial [Nitrososphaerales archaeon]|nr:AAA family ATPase [Nitrososphaerales archaeon]
MSVIPSRDADDDNWWKNSKVLRAIYHPLLMASDADYRRWYLESTSKSKKPSRKLVRQQLNDAHATIAPFAPLVTNFVGYSEVKDEILSAVQYWVVKDEAFRSICPTAPPQVFIVKGSSGTGKTSLVHSVMVEGYAKGAEKQIPVYAQLVSPHKIFDKWLGESEKKIAQVFDEAFRRPTILFIDEAQTLAREQGDSAGAPDSGVQAFRGVQTTLLEKINEMVYQDRRCILIMATNEFGSVIEAVRRRGSSGTIDLDSEIDRPMLVEITRKNLEKYKIELDPNNVLHTIEAKVRALGHGTVTPADIANAFQIVMENKTKHVRSSYLKKLSSALGKDEGTPMLNITLEDFRDISRLKEYNEDKRSDEMRHIVTRIKPKITLDDVGGLSGIKENLLKDIEVSLNPEMARRAGATPVRGILLHGHPGTGKTWLVQAIGGELQATMYMIRGAQIVKPYHGQTEKIIIDIFDEARKNAPSIIIIDELDALTLKRELGGSLGAVTTLLSEMGGLKPLEGVVVIGTTNKLQLVDEAFLRAGRFDRIVEVPPPRNDTERLEIIRVHLNKCRSFVDSSVTEEKILELFGKRTFTPAKIERVISDAIELRLKELNAAYKISHVPANDDTQLNKLRKIYEDDLTRVKANLGFSAAIPEEKQGYSYDTLKQITPESYKLTMTHFKAAVASLRDESVEEIQKIASALRGPSPVPTVGKVYGLAALASSGSGGMASEGTVAVIECVCNPFGRRGRALVIGSEIAKSVRASAEHARVFLNEQCDWVMRNHEFFLDFITFAKGLDTQVIQGPSAGVAITLAQYSVAAKEEVLPNVVITGGVTPKGELVQVGGLDFKGMGKFVAALNTDGVDTIII